MEEKIIQKKSRILLWVVVVIFVILLGRLAYLQLLETSRYETLSRQNHMRLNTIIAPRGEIYDDKGIKLVGNQPVYTVSLMNLGKGLDQNVINKVVNLLGLDPNEVAKKIKDSQLRPYQSIRLASNVSIDDVTKIEERRMDLPGVVIDVEPIRSYPIISPVENHTILAHVLGYVQEIKADQLAANQDKGYQLGDMYGQDGLENTFESYLRGQNGARQVEVDAQGRPVRDLGVKNPVPGDNLTLTIDSKLQQDTEVALATAVQNAHSQGLEAKGGAAVMVDVKTGAVKAMASYPGYDPAVWVNGLSQSQWQDLLNTGGLINRAIQPYPPGSTFKMVMASAALQLGKITPSWSIADPGYYIYGDTRFNDDVPGGHGIVDVRKAIQVSCDTFFYTVGHKLLGVDNIDKFAKMFGLGEKTGIELPGERSGVVPTPDWKYQHNKAYLDAIYNPKFKAINDKYDQQIANASDPAQKASLQQAKDNEIKAVQKSYDSHKWDLTWQVYDTINMSIGQGYNAYTPLQLAMYTATIANGGTLYKPYLVSKITNPKGKIVKTFNPQVRSHVGVSPENLQVVQEGMHMVTQSPGTAAGIFDSLPFGVAAKTGTAQVKGHNDHALFVCYAPYDKPQVAIAVVIDYGGYGASAAAPVARDMLASYFNVNIAQKGQLASGSE